MCELCKARPALINDILCRECSDRYVTLLGSAKKAASKMNAPSVDNGETVLTRIKGKARSSGQLTQSLLEAPIQTGYSADQLLQNRQDIQIPIARRRRTPEKVGYLMLGIGLAALAISVALTSTILTFIGLGLTFWGMLVFFIRPQSYVKSDLMSATAISSMKSVDEMMLGMGYRERGVYIPAESGKAVVFVPSEPFSRIPQNTTVDGKLFLSDPNGLIVVPPGLALSNLIQKKLGFDLKNCGVETLIHRLPKVLVEDLEIVRDVEIKVEGNSVKFRLIDSIYADFCREVRGSSRRCGLGCPMCSALACILAVATGKPVLFEEDKDAGDGHTTLSEYRLLDESRL